MSKEFVVLDPKKQAQLKKAVDNSAETFAKLTSAFAEIFTGEAPAPKKTRAKKEKAAPLQAVEQEHNPPAQHPATKRRAAAQGNGSGLPSLPQ